MSGIEQHAFWPCSLRLRGLVVLATAMLVLALPTPSWAEAKDVIKPAYTTRSCVRDPNGPGGLTCTDTLHPAFPNAGGCTRYFLAFHNGANVGDQVDACVDFMGVTKFCNDHDMSVSSNTDPQGKINIVCIPHYHYGTVDEQFVRIVTGIDQGLITAAIGTALMIRTGDDNVIGGSRPERRV